MSNSITASNVAPFSGLILSDANYTVTSNFPAAGATGSSPSLFFPNIEYPTVGKMIVQLTNTALTNSSGSANNYVGLQHSIDNVNWVAIPQFTASLLVITDSGALTSPASATPAQVLLPPNVNPYIRANATVLAGGATTGGITGSYTLSVLFAA